ncbi:hypothetical protein LCGC14_1165720 [marine sediment metagenome]|uniref:Endonuclease NucS n=1 Tax=marine sediment metagenome TaxID=412755 RepID=A0A0F9LW70_9ZZZZ
MSIEKPTVWQMLKETIEQLGGKASYTEIKNYIWTKYGDVNENTINSQIVACTVNQPSRIHYQENSKPRVSNSKYDFLFSIKRGYVVSYDVDKHGEWEIKEDEFGKLKVVQAELDELDEAEFDEKREEMMFPLENHLRDFIAKNIETIKVNGKALKLYIDDTGRNGVEYPTKVGNIDILAIDNEGAFIVFELKVSRGSDSAIGQILRYMGWIKSNLALDNKVKGVIVAKNIIEKLRYAASITPDITLFEYQLDFLLDEVNLKI